LIRSARSLSRMRSLEDSQSHRQRLDYRSVLSQYRPDLLRHLFVNVETRLHEDQVWTFSARRHRRHGDQCKYGDCSDRSDRSRGLLGIRDSASFHRPPAEGHPSRALMVLGGALWARRWKEGQYRVSAIRICTIVIERTRHRPTDCKLVVRLCRSQKGSILSRSHG